MEHGKFKALSPGIATARPLTPEHPDALAEGGAGVGSKSELPMRPALSAALLLLGLAEQLAGR